MGVLVYARPKRPEQYLQKDRATPSSVCAPDGVRKLHKINLKGMSEDRGIMKEAENIIKKSNFYKDKIIKYIEGKI